MQYFEGLAVGQEWEPDGVTVDEAEIREFAGRYDPQPFHVDVRAAERNFGGLIASGWHTASLCMRPVAESVLDDVAVVAAAGVDDLRWYEPVRPGDVLAVEVRVVDKEPWSGRRGLVTFRVTATNRDDELVHSRKDLVVVERERPAAEE